MKKLYYLMIAMALMISAKAQVGIGTTAPNSNAVLDIFSPSKGVLIPRIVDTGTVTSPLEGMIIYNKHTKTPYYHDGKQWLSLGGRLPSTMTSNTDRITYQVTAPGFSGAEEDVYSLSHGVSSPVSIGIGGTTVGTASLSSFNFMKKFDINSKSMKLASIQGTKLTSIEFKVYASGSLVPYLSYRYKNAYVESYQLSGSAGGDVLVESVSIAFENYGFKDWVNNLEFGYNVATKTLTAY
jgi:type VI protein secretion system component Hcp